MATSYTQHYGLCQWMPGDPFLREEFNENAVLLDTALEAVSRRTEALEGTVPTLGYNLGNLMLQSYYDGKYTGYKRAILFDGFHNLKGLASLSAGVVQTSAPPALKLYAKGVGDRVQHYGTGAWASPGMVSDSWTAAGCGRVTGVKLRVSGGSTYGVASFTVTLSGGGKAVSANGTSNSAAIVEQTLTFSPTFLLESGVDYVLSVRNTSVYALSVYTSGSESTLGYHLLCAPIDVPAAEVTSVVQRAGRTGRSALAWVRHDGGSVGLSLNGVLMEKDRSREAMTMQGQRCTESAYRLDGAVAESVSVRLWLDTLGMDEMTVYDYGVILL